MRRPQNFKTSGGKDENGYEMYKNEKSLQLCYFFTMTLILQFGVFLVLVALKLADM